MKKRFKPEVRAKQFDRFKLPFPLWGEGYAFAKTVWIVRPSYQRIAKLIETIAKRVKRKRPIKGHYWYPNYCQTHMLKRHLKKH